MRIGGSHRALVRRARRAGADLLVIAPGAPRLGAMLRGAGDALVREGDAVLLLARPIRATSDHHAARA